MYEIDIYRFCPRCGKSLRQHQTKYLTCATCGLILYLNPKPTNAIFLFNESKEVLLAKRKNDPQQGLWDSIGGFMETGETVEESVARETQEELGITTKNPVYFGSYTDHYEIHGVNYPLVCMCYYAYINSTQHFTPQDDITKVQFFPHDKIPYKYMAFPSMKQALQDCVRMLK